MFNKTVDSIMSSFKKTIQELETHAESSYKRAEQYQDSIAKLNVSRSLELDEGNRARNIIGKLTTLIG